MSDSRPFFIPNLESRMTLAWILFSVYLIATTWLGWVGFRKTKDFGSFAIGAGDISPFQVGVTLAAATASAATFIINPGFVYVDGLAAFMHLGVGVYLGFVTMLLVLSFKFRRIGEDMQALTIPDWIGKRYGSKNFSLYFGIINLFSFAFVVLLVGGISIVMQSLLGVSNYTALLITLVFVTGYVLLGGTYAHVYTNMLQGMLMIGITCIVVVSGILLTANTPEWTSVLSSQSDHFMSWVNPDSELYNDVFSTYITGFVIGAALVCQPHILTKALYVRRDDQVRSYIIVFSIVFFLFLLLLLAGFWAHLAVEPSAIVDAETGAFRQDLVMTAYLQKVFPPSLFTIISIVLLAASMSTLDGLLVGMSTITANDVVLNVLERRESMTSKRAMKIAMYASHIVLILIAILAFWVAIEPPDLLGIFGQVGVYGLVVAAVPPLLVGILYKQASLKGVWIASFVGLVIHLGLFFYGRDFFPDSNIAFKNPGVTSTIGLIFSLTPLFIFQHIRES
jgi:SSS family solute:Na+ symporter/sodium/pantothenate symporter